MELKSNRENGKNAGEVRSACGAGASRCMQLYPPWAEDHALSWTPAGAAAPPAMSRDSPWNPTKLVTTQAGRRGQSHHYGPGL